MQAKHPRIVFSSRSSCLNIDDTRPLPFVDSSMSSFLRMSDSRQYVLITMICCELHLKTKPVYFLYAIARMASCKLQY